MITIFAKELLPEIKKYEVVLFGMAINNAFYSGLLYDIALNFPDVKAKENAISPYGDRKKYGTILEIECEGIKFCPCYMNDGGYNRRNGISDCVKYDCLEQCLKAVAEKYKGKKICSPYIGASYYDGQGDKERIKAIYERVFTDCDIDVYDFDQPDSKMVNFRNIVALYDEYRQGNKTREEFNEGYRRLIWEKEHGIFIPMPDDFKVKRNLKRLVVKKSDLEK